MAFFRRWLLIFCALILGGGQLLASPSREERAYTAAAAAFQDELWQRAETEFAQFTERYPKSGRLAEAVLFQAQAQFKQTKYDEAIALLDAHRSQAGALANRYAYWLGEAQFARGDFSAAAATFAALANNAAESSLKLTAAVEAATALEKLGAAARLEEWLTATNGVFARTAALDGANELVARGWLLLAESRLARQNFSGALEVLGRLKPRALTPDLDWQRLYLTGRAKFGADDFSGVLVVTTNLLAAKKNSAGMADAFVLRAAVWEKLNQPALAISVWSENLANSGRPEKQQEAILKISALAMAQNNFTDAVASLQKYLAAATNSPVQELAVFTLGELQLKDFSVTNHLELAQARFNQLLSSATNSPLVGRALLDRGWCRWLAGDAAGSLADFQAAAERLPVSEEQAVAKFKTGDAQFALTNFTAARESYRSVTTGYAALPTVEKSLGARALYQILRAELQLHDADGAQQTLGQLLEKFPRSELVDNSLLLVGESFSDFSTPAKAREIFHQFDELVPDSPLKPQAELAVARTFEREQNWSEAVAHYEAWVKKFPTNALLPQAEYARVWAGFQAGDETNTLVRFSVFTANYPTNALAPLAQWWVADHFFRTGNFVGAETNYELIFQTPAWKNSTNLFYQAQLMAGRAAAARLGFSDAARYFTGLTADTNCPPAFASQAMFAYGSVLMRMDSPDATRPLANFELATNVFGQLAAANPTNETGARANVELADCCLQLGAFDAATNVYAQVANSPYAGAGLRSRAQVGWGLGLEKKAALLPAAERNPLLKQALDVYRDLLYTDAAADPFWVKKAGLQALPLMITLKDGNVDKFFDRLEWLLPSLKNSLEKKRAALKN